MDNLVRWFTLHSLINIALVGAGYTAGSVRVAMVYEEKKIQEWSKQLIIE